MSGVQSKARENLGCKHDDLDVNKFDVPSGNNFPTKGQIIYIYILYFHVLKHEHH